MSGIKITKLVGFGSREPMTLQNRTVTLGTDPGCDVRFDPTWDKTVSPRHCHLEYDGKQWFVLDDGSSQGTRIAGRRIEAPTAFSSGTEIELGVGGPRVRCEPVLIQAPSPAMQQPSYTAPNAAQPWMGATAARPGTVQVVAVLTMISGVLNILAAIDLIFGAAILYAIVLNLLGFLGVPGLTIFKSAPLLQILPPVYLLSLGILEILYATRLLPDPARIRKPALFVAVMQIVAILFWNLFSLITGILSLVFMGDRKVKEYLAGPAMQPIGPGMPPAPAQGHGFGAGLVGGIVAGAFFLVLLCHFISGAFALADAEDRARTAATTTLPSLNEVVNAPAAASTSAASAGAQAWWQGQLAAKPGASMTPGSPERGQQAAALGKSLLQTPGEWEPVVFADNQIFPSYLLATAAVVPPAVPSAAMQPRLGDPNGLVGIRIKSPAFRTALRVEVTGSELIEPSVFEGTLEQGNIEHFVFPKINYRYETLKNNRQITPANLTFRVMLGNSDLGQKTLTVRVRSVNDCPFIVVQNPAAKTAQEAGVTPMMWMFAAFVNEHHPAVDTLLREALDTRVVNEFAGYQKPPEGVLKEAFAIWSALQKRGVKYSNITTPSAESEYIYSQHVRFLEESLGHAQANCVDGSVLMASVLRKIGVSSFLVTVPGHMYMGFALDRDGKTMVYLETTMLGSVDARGAAPLAAAGDDGALQGVVDQIRAAGPSGESFVRAISEATNRTRKNAAEFNKPGSRFLIMDLDAVRQHGIDPIGFTGTSRGKI